MEDINLNSIKILIADLDDTLAPSKLPIDDEMANLIEMVLERINIAVISGARYKQFEYQIVQVLDGDPEKFTRMYLLPTNGSAAYNYKEGRWNEIYSEALTKSEKIKIIDAMKRVVDSFSFALPEHIYGDQIEDRGTQITYSALGQNAPIELKRVWDPDLTKRKILKKELATLLPEFSVQIGGTTSIDITRKGRDKAYGIKNLMEITGYNLEEMCFMGDKLEEGGNDYSVKSLGITCISVNCIQESKNILRKIVDCFPR
jgi:HAD superfamily hydrolase (TIGR01484 family)